MVHAFWLEGSGAKCTPRCSTAALRSEFTTPGCTTARWFSASTERIRFIRANETTMPPCRAIAPPESPVPAPRPTIGTTYRVANRAISTTSLVSRGNTTQSGRAVSTEPSYSYSIRSSSVCKTPREPKTFLRSWTSREFISFCAIGPPAATIVARCGKRQRTLQWHVQRETRGSVAVAARTSAQWCILLGRKHRFCEALGEQTESLGHAAAVSGRPRHSRSAFRCRLLDARRAHSPRRIAETSWR